MAVAEILKVTLLGYSDLKNKIITDLHRSGLIEIKEVRKTEISKIDNIKESEIEKINNEIQELSKKVSDLTFASQILSRYQKTKGFLESMSDTKFEYTNEEYIKIVKNFKYNITGKIKKYISKINENENRINTIKNRINELKIWESIKVDINDVKNISKNIRVDFIKIDNKFYNEFIENFQELNLAEKTDINKDSEFNYLTITYHLDIERNIKALYSKYNVALVEFNDVSTTIKDKINEYEEEIKKLHSELEDIEKELKEYATYYDDLLVCIDYWKNMLSRVEVRKYFYNTESVFLIQGWIKKRDVEKLKNILSKYKEIEIITSIPDEDEDVPVVLENKRLISPFEMVTKLFGLPKKKEIDPTPLFAPFFALFFGICLTDAGYGLLLIAIATLLMKKNKYMSEGTKKLMKILVISGFFTVIFGIFAGGYFGIDFAKLPKSLLWAKEIRDKLAFLDPLKNPLRLFAFVLGLGVLQVFTGFLIKFVTLLKEKEYRGAIVEALSWMLIMIGLIAGPMLKNNYITALAVIGAVIILFFSSTNKNILMRIAKGAYGLYDITGIFGDIVSYSRLFALALSTGVIAMVINIIVMIIFKMMIKMSVIGYIIGVIVLVLGLVFGHLFNMVINALGAFIHTTRLQFVEYFTKFYEGGGEEFRPFKEELDYVYIKEN